MVATAALAASLLRPGVTAAPPGALGSPAWRTATHEHFGTTDVYLLEDAKNVYVAFAAQAPSGAGDAVTLYLWSDKAAYSFAVDARGVRSAWCSGGEKLVPRWTASERSSGSGYAVTMRLPRALFSGRPQSRWLLQAARVTGPGSTASTWPQSQGQAGNVVYAAPFAADPQRRGAYTAAVAPAPSTAEPKVAKAADVEQLWPRQAGTMLPAPAIAASAGGVAIAKAENGLQFTGVGAQSPDGTQQNAQSVDWTSADRHASAGIQRIATAGGSSSDVHQAVSVGYDNQNDMRFSAGVAAEDGNSVADASKATYDYYDFSLYGKSGSLDMRWNAAGPQYNPLTDDAPAPGTAGYTLSLSRAFGSVSLNADANRYHDDLGNLADANERAAITAALGPALSFDVSAASNAATQYAAVPFAQSSAGLQYALNGTQASVAYRQDRFANGVAREAAVSGGFTLPLLGMLQFQHSRTMTFDDLSGIGLRQSSSASLMHRIRSGYVSIGYQDAAGAANFTFSFQDRLPIGLLRATYYNPNTMFSSPNFSVKLVQL